MYLCLVGLSIKNIYGWFLCCFYVVCFERCAILYSGIVVNVSLMCLLKPEEEVAVSLMAVAAEGEAVTA